MFRQLPATGISCTKAEAGEATLAQLNVHAGVGTDKPYKNKKESP